MKFNKKMMQNKYLAHKNHLEYKYLPEIVFGGIDGSVTTFGVVSGVVGASLSSSIVLILGFANLIADGFSMATSDYFSTKTRNEQGTSRQKPTKTAFATFLAFLVIGLIPLLPFITAFITKSSYVIENQFLYSAILTGLALVIVGSLKGIITGKHPVKSAVETFIIGSVAAALAFVAGYLLSILVS